MTPIREMEKPAVSHTLQLVVKALQMQGALVPEKAITGEEIYRLAEHESDKQSIYTTLHQYAVKKNVLMRVKDDSGHVFRYYIPHGAKLPNNLEDEMLRDAARTSAPPAQPRREAKPVPPPVQNHTNAAAEANSPARIRVTTDAALVRRTRATAAGEAVECKDCGMLGTEPNFQHDCAPRPRSRTQAFIDDLRERRAKLEVELAAVNTAIKAVEALL